MQDIDDIKPLPEDDDTAGSDVDEKDGDSPALSDDEPLGDLESLPGESMPEIPVEAVIPPVQEAEEAPEHEPFEPDENGELVEAKPVDSKTRRFFRKLIRWTVGLLIIFGLGLLTGIFMFYRPSLDESKNAIQQITADLDNANERILDLQTEISGLKAQIASLEPFEDANVDLMAAQDDFRLHIAILEARVDVASARLPLMAAESAQARVYLDKTGESLDLITELLDPDQREVAVAMVDRLNLVLSEIDDDPYAAESDLDVLATKLLELEDALFSD
jgi:hypothetical protein